MKTFIVALACLAVISMPVLDGAAAPGTVTLRVRTYDDNGQGHASNPNDPVGFIACGSTVRSTVSRIYVDVKATGLGGLITGVDIPGFPRVWQQDTARSPGTGGATLDQVIFSGRNRVYAALTAGGSAECVIFK